MAGKQKTYKVELVEKLKSILEAVPEKPKSEKEMSTSAALASLKSQIKSLQAKGYTLEEIVAIFKENGVDAGISTLKNAVKKPRPKKQTSEENK